MANANTFATALSQAESKRPIAWALSIVTGASVCLCVANPRLFIYAIACAALIALLMFPEITLALYVLIGDLKGDDRIAALIPFDWTVTVCIVIVAGIILNLLRGKRIASVPSSYFALVVLTAWMAVSLAYAPSFSGGLEKLGRFVAITGIAVVAPFLVLGTPAAMKRFLVAFGTAALVVSGYALLGLGGNDRLVSPSDNTIGLGHVASALLLLLWFAEIPQDRWITRVAFYASLLVPLAALIGSGSRGSLIACLLAVFASAFFSRQRRADVLLLAVLAACTLPFSGIPSASLDYLSTLYRTSDVSSLLDFRGDLLAHGWQLLQTHPLFGVGIAGFRYSSSNPEIYKWPHNIFLEIACELGIPAAMLMAYFFFAAAREAWAQLRCRTWMARSFSQVVTGWLFLGIVNGLNTGDINSDRSTWLFASLVFVVGTYSAKERATAEDAAMLGGVAPA